MSYKPICVNKCACSVCVCVCVCVCTLAESGLCYPKTQTARQETRLTFPNEMLLASLKAYVRHAAQLLSQVDKGAGLEFVTCMTASLGLLSDSLQTQVV